MDAKKSKQKSANGENPVWVRASISFPPDIYAAIENVAKKNKVSIAWIMRDAAENYLAKASWRNSKI
jgi:metal-responsive CopG/Arc/MetJ family transcriptional regulator